MQYALEHGIIDLAYVQEQVEMNKRKELLEKHPYKIWKGKDGKWYTYLPDTEKGRVLKKRTSEDKIKELIVDFWLDKDESDKKIGYKEIKRMTLRKIFPNWLEYKAARTDSTSYIKRITADWKRFYEKDEISDKPIVEFDKLYLDSWAHTIIKSNKLTKKSYYDMSIIIRQCLDYALEKGYVTENSFRKVSINKKLFIRKKKPASQTQVYLTNEAPMLIDEMIRRYKNNPKNTAPIAVILCFEIGVRIGELVCLRESDIDGDYIRIQRQEVRDFIKTDDFTMKFNGFRVVEYTKSSDEYRDVYLTENAKQIIDFVKSVNKKYGMKDEDYLFLENGKRISHYAVQSRILRGCQAINIPIKTAHKIRKTFISTLIDGGVNIDEIRRTAGHSDERTTYGNYCFNRETSAETKEKIENALKKVIKGNQKIVQA